MNTQHSNKYDSPIPFEPVFTFLHVTHRPTAMHITQAHVLTQTPTL